MAITSYSDSSEAVSVVGNDDGNAVEQVIPEGQYNEELQTISSLVKDSLMQALGKQNSTE